MTLARILFICFLLLCVAGIGRAQKQDSPRIRNPGLPSGSTTIISDPDRRSAPAQSDATWSTYASPDGDFTVSAPASLTRQEGPPPAGINRLRQYSTQQGDVFYFVRVVDMAATPSPAMIEGLVRGMELGVCEPLTSAGHNCRFANERSLTYSGLPLRQYTIMVDEAERGVLRVIFGQGHLYNYGVFRVASTHPAASRFLESFHLLPATISQLGGTAPAAPPPPAPSGSARAAGATNPLLAVAIIPYREAAWREHISRAGGFSAHFPGEPASSAPTPGNPLHFTTVRTDIALFTITYNELPSETVNPEVLRRAYDVARDQFLLNSRTRLVSEQEIRHPGHLGREILTAGEGTLIRNRMLAVGKRFYQVAVGTEDYRQAPAARQRLLEGVAQRFLSSFRILAPN